MREEFLNAETLKRGEVWAGRCNLLQDIPIINGFGAIRIGGLYAVHLRASAPPR
jgi:hypothetical protein